MLSHNILSQTSRHKNNNNSIKPSNMSMKNESKSKPRLEAPNTLKYVFTLEPKTLKILKLLSDQNLNDTIYKSKINKKLDVYRFKESGEVAVLSYIALSILECGDIYMKLVRDTPYLYEVINKYYYANYRYCLGLVLEQISNNPTMPNNKIVSNIYKDVINARSLKSLINIKLKAGSEVIRQTVESIKVNEFNLRAHFINNINLKQFLELGMYMEKYTDERYAWFSNHTADLYGRYIPSELWYNLSKKIAVKYKKQHVNLIKTVLNTMDKGKIYNTGITTIPVLELKKYDQPKIQKFYEIMENIDHHKEVYDGQWLCMIGSRFTGNTVFNHKLTLEDIIKCGFTITKEKELIVTRNIINDLVIRYSRRNAIWHAESYSRYNYEKVCDDFIDTASYIGQDSNANKRWKYG